MVQSQTRPLAGLMVVAATSLGLVGVSWPAATATATATAAATTASRPAVAGAGAAAWFHDPVSAAGRRAEIPVPTDPAGYTGAVRPTRATFRTHSGALAVPVGWASGHTVVAPEALALTKQGLFAFNSPTLSAVAAAEVGQLRTALARVRRVRCEGYTDFGGPAAHQQALSLQRAQAVCALLQRDQPGLTTFSVGYGGNDPVVVGGTPADRAQNRRVVLVATVSTPGPTLPGAPHLSRVVAGDGTADVTFSAPSRNGGTRITGYRMSTDGGRSWHPVRPAPGGPGPYTVTLDGLTDGTSYPVTVEARNAVGVGPSSRPLEVTPRGSVHVTVASAPRLTIASPGDTTATITFTAPISDGGTAITAYQASTDGGTTWTTMTPTGPGPYVTTLTGLTDGITYPVTVRAVNTAGDSPASNSLDVTPTPALTVPGAPVIIGGTDDYSAPNGYVYADLTFTDPTSDGGSPLTGYQVSDDGGMTWTPLTYVPGTPDTAQVEVVEIDPCAPYSYTFTLEAINDQGPGPASNAEEVDFNGSDGPLRPAGPDC
jgi:outer membrane protein OmpA-like peptidoglycan-associated protein